MTDADRLRLLELEEEEYQYQQKSAGKPGADDKTSGLEATLYGAGQTITAGHVDELAGSLAPLVMRGGGVRLGKGAQPSPDDTPEVAALKRQLLAEQDEAPTDREILKNTVQARIDQAQGEHPVKYGAGRLGAGVVMAPLIAAAAPAAGVGGALLTGGAIGGANALGESRANLGRGEFGQYLKDGAMGTALGVGTGGLGYGIASALGGGGALLPTLASGTLTGGVAGTLLSEADTLPGKLADGGVSALWGLAGSGAGYGGARMMGGLGRGTVGGFVKPTPEAQALRKQGVEPTLGQMNPKSLIGQVEDVGTSHAATGEWLKQQRAVPAKQYEDLAIRTAVPKGGTAPVGSGRAEQMADVKRQVDARYDSVRASPLSERAQARPVSVDRVKKAFGLVSKDPDVLSSNLDQSKVDNFLQNQATILERQGPTPNALMRVRSNIRKQRDAQPEGSVLREMLGRADQSVTNRLRYSLPGKTFQTLQDTDANYGTYATMQDAVRAAGDQQLMTPSHLSAAVVRNTDPGVYARGGGGPIRQLAQQGHAVLDPQSPQTGARLLGSAPVVGRIATGALAAANSNPTAKAFMLGETAAQQKVAGLLQALRNASPKMSPTSGLAPETLGLRRYFSDALAAREQEEDARMAGR